MSIEGIQTMIDCMMNVTAPDGGFIAHKFFGVCSPDITVWIELEIGEFENIPSLALQPSHQADKLLIGGKEQSSELQALC